MSYITHVAVHRRVAPAPLARHVPSVSALCHLIALLCVCVCARAWCTVHVSAQALVSVDAPSLTLLVTSCDAEGKTQADHQTLPFVTIAGAGPLDGLGARSEVVVVPLGPGCTRVALGAGVRLMVPRAPMAPYPFPPAVYPATLLARDEFTAGNWVRGPCVRARQCVGWACGGVGVGAWPLRPCKAGGGMSVVFMCR
jgi:hypothetical protein